MPRSTALGSGGDPLIWLGLAAATLFFVATGAVAYLNFQTLKHDSALVVRTGDTLTALEDVLSTVRDAETGQRGYGPRSFRRGRAETAPLLEVNHH